MVIVIVIENIHAYVIGNCNLNFVIVIGKSITSLNMSHCILLAVIMLSYHGKCALRNDHMTLRDNANQIPTCE